MKRYISMLVALVVTLFAVNVFAYNPPPAPAKGWYVTDLAGKLSEAQKRALNNKIEQVNKQTANEFGILLLPDMGGDNIEDVAHTTFKAWGVGKKDLDNGCLIVVALKERKSRIETGKGVEGDVPDLKANDILKANLNPHLKNGDFYGGFDSTLSALASQVESRRAERAAQLAAQKRQQERQANPVTTPVTRPTSNNAGNQETPISSGPRTSSGGCQAGGDAGSSFPTLLFGVGALGLMFWILRSHSKRKAREQAERERIEEQLRQQRIAARRKFEAELEAAKRERDRVMNLPTPAVSVPSVPPRPLVEKVATLRPTVVRHDPLPLTRHEVPTTAKPATRLVTPTPVAKSPIPSPVPRPTPSPTASELAATAAATAAAVALRRQQQEREDEERRVREAGEENRRRQARMEEERREEERREARRREEEREEDERRERRERERREEEERWEARRQQEEADRQRREQEEEDRRRRDEESRSSYSSYDSGSSSWDSGSSDSGSGFGGGDSGGGGSSSDW